MKKLVKIITVFALCLMLSACGGHSNYTVNTRIENRSDLNITLPEPLELAAVEWKIENGRFSLDSKGYKNLSTNTERIQNRLKLYLEIIKKQREYYMNK